jgi:predicted DNA-binding transcriptional regulator YafY
MTRHNPTTTNTQPGNLMQANLARLIIMLTALPTFPRRLETGKLRQQLFAAGHDVDLRTVQRDLNNLSNTYAISNDGAKPAGWYWDKDAKPISLPALDPHAALVLQLARTHLERLLPAATLDHLAPQFRQARETLDQYSNGLRKWPDKIRVLPRGPKQATPSIQPDVQSVIYDALLQERRARVSYQKNLAQTAKEYEINPLGLVVRDRVSYLICTIGDFTDLRQLVLHRMQTAELLDAPAACPEGFDLDTYIRQGEMGFPCGDTLTLQVAFTPAAAVQVKECPLSADQTVTEGETEEEDILITATVPDSMELRWWLLSFGDEAEVLEPPELRAWFREVAGNLVGYYDDGA